MKIALVCTRDGHLTETLQLLDAFQEHQIFFVTPHSPRDEELGAIAPVYFSKNVDAKLLSFLGFFGLALRILLREKPDVILGMGSEIVIPFFFWGRLFGMKTIYVESWCRLDDLSKTGRIVYRWVDELWVQWPQLVSSYPRAKYHGAVI